MERMCMSPRSSLQYRLIKTEKTPHSSTASNIDQIFEQCRSNTLVVVYAKAEIGKSAVLCHAARSRLEGISQYS